VNLPIKRPSAGFAILASDTQSLQEAIKHNEMGKLVGELLDQPQKRQRLGGPKQGHLRRRTMASKPCAYQNNWRGSLKYAFKTN
jgi:hypothetical protein